MHTEHQKDMQKYINDYATALGVEIAAYINREGGGSADGIVEIIAAHAPKETGIKPDNAQAARHEPEYDPEQAETLAMLKKALPHKFEQEPSVPISKLKELRHNIDSYAFSQLEKLIDKAEKD